MFIDDDYFDYELDSLLSEFGFAGEVDTPEEKQAKKDFERDAGDTIIIWEWF